MKHYKVSKPLNNSTVSKCMMKNGLKFSSNNNIRFKTLLLRSDLCGYNDAYIVVKGTITIEGDDDHKHEIKRWRLRIMLHLHHAYQKSITHL